MYTGEDFTPLEDFDTSHVINEIPQSLENVPLVGNQYSPFSTSSVASASASAAAAAALGGAIGAASAISGRQTVNTPPGTLPTQILRPPKSQQEKNQDAEGRRRNLLLLLLLLLCLASFALAAAIAGLVVGSIAKYDVDNGKIGGNFSGGSGGIGANGTNGLNGTGFTYGGDWNSSAAYTQFEVVNQSGIAYFALVNNTGQDPSTSPNVWFPITGPQGLAGNGTVIINNGTIFITNGTNYISNGSISVNNGSTINIINNGTLVIDNGTVTVINGTIIVNNGTIQVNNGSTINIINNGTLVIDNGTVTVVNGTTIVNNGTIQVNNGTTIVNNGTLVINNGTTIVVQNGANGTNGTNGSTGLGFSYAGTWNNSATYTPLQVVNFSGVSYYAIQNNTNSEPDTNPQDWIPINGANGTSLVSRGTWNGTATYLPLNVVQYNGTAYLALTNSTGVNPQQDTNFTDWVPIGAMGPQGQPGAAGSPGNDGSNGNNSYTMTTAAFTMPAVNSAVGIPVQNNQWASIGQYIYVATAGTFFVTGLPNAQTITAINIGSAGNAPQFSVIASPQLVGPTGSPGVAINGTNGTAVNGTNGLGFSYAGNWNSSAAYTQFQVVNFSGVSYYAIQNNTNAEPDTNPQDWFPVTGANGTGLVSRGTWNGTTTYQPLNVVQYNGTAYLALTNSTGVNPQQDTNFTNWVPIGAAGAQGAPGVAGAPGAPGINGSAINGTNGNNSYTMTTAAFTMPAVNSAVDIPVYNNQWVSVGQYIYTSTAGTFLVSGLPNAQTITAINIGSVGNAPQFSVIPSLQLVGPTGSPGVAVNGTNGTAVNGTNGTNGNGFSYVGTWNNSASYTQLQVVNFSGISYFATQNNTNAEPDTNPQDWFPLTGQNGTSLVARGVWNNTATYQPLNVVQYNGTVYLSFTTNTGVNPQNDTNNTNWVPLGTQGSQGAQGIPGLNGTNGTNGINAFTNTTAAYTQPVAGGTATVSVVNSAWMALGQVVFVQNGGYYMVLALPSNTSVTLQALGYGGTVGSGGSVPSGSSVVAGGLRGTGSNAFTITTTVFNVPTVGGSSSFSVQDNSWMAAGEPVYINNSGTFIVVQANTSDLTVVVSNPGYPNNAAPSTMIPVGTLVTPTGFQGASFSEQVTACLGTGGNISNTSQFELFYINTCGSGSSFNLSLDSNKHYILPTSGRYVVNFDLTLKALTSYAYLGLALFVSINDPFTPVHSFYSLSSGSSGNASNFIRASFNDVISMQRNSTLSFFAQFLNASGTYAYGNQTSFGGFTVSDLSIQKVSTYL